MPDNDLLDLPLRIAGQLAGQVAGPLGGGRR